MNSHKLLFAVLILAVCLTQFASDIYAPSLPAIAANLHTTMRYIQLSMSAYLLGAALSQLIYGPLSEGIGRKTPLIIGLIIMLVGSIICLFAPYVSILIVGRLIQGCGAGACASLWRPIFRDVYSGEELAKYSSYLVIFIMFIIPAAPVLGGYLQLYFGWRSIFVFMTVYAALAFVGIVSAFKETNQHHHKNRLQLTYIKNTYLTLLTSRIFMGITICTFLGYGAFFCWFTTGPILLIHLVGISPVMFGWLTFFGGGAAYALAGQLNGRLVTRFGIPTMMRVGFFFMIIAGVLMIVGKIMIGLSVWIIMLPIILFYFGATFLWPNAFATAFTPFGKIAGYAGALYGFMQISGGAIISALVAHLPANNQLPLGSVMLIASMLAWMIYEFAITWTSKQSPQN